MHDVLVDEELVFFVERLRGLGDDDGIVCRIDFYVSRSVLCAVQQGVNLTLNGLPLHVIVFR